MEYDRPTHHCTRSDGRRNRYRITRTSANDCRSNRPSCCHDRICFDRRARTSKSPQAHYSSASRNRRRTPTSEKKNVKIVAQIWGNTPENYTQVIREIANEMEFDGIDINMGCPVPKVVRRGCCSGLIGNPTLAKEIIQAAQQASHLPVSVKTRIGLKSIATEEWAAHLLETRPAALTFHGRTQKQMSVGPANWNEITKPLASAIRSHPTSPLSATATLNLFMKLAKNAANINSTER